MTAYNDAVYVSAGSVNDAWNYQYNRAGIFKFENEEWINYNQFRFPVFDTLMDFITVAVNPEDESIWGGSYGGGELDGAECAAGLGRTCSNDEIDQ